MKHLLNDLSEEEKNNIREQHAGGMKVSNARFKTLLETKSGDVKPLVEQFEEDDYDFGFESPSCPSCKGNGCEECDGSGMKRNSVVNNDDDEELYSGAPERLVKHMDSGKIVGTHKHGVGYTPNKHGIRLGHSSHPTSIPNFTKFDDEDDMYSINEGVNVVPKGKSDLIQVLRNHINSTEKDNKWTAMDVAQTIYNDCANFMNKTDIFSDKTKYGEDVSQPPAEFAKREQVPESSIEKTETDSTETQY